MEGCRNFVRQFLYYKRHFHTYLRYKEHTAENIERKKDVQISDYMQKKDNGKAEGDV